MITLKIIMFGALAFMAVTILYLWERNQNLQDDLAVRDAIIKQHQETQRIHKKYVEQTEMVRLENEALRRDLLEMEGGDAPLSDYLSRVSERVFEQ